MPHATCLAPFQWRKKKGYIIPASEFKNKPLPQQARPIPKPPEKNEEAAIATEIKPLPIEETPQEKVSTGLPPKAIEETKVEEPEQEYTPTKPKATQVSGFSLSSIALKKAAKEKSQPKVIETDLPEDPFELSQVEVLWNQYIEALKKEGKSNIASILSMNTVGLNSGFELSFTVANKMNREEMSREMEHLLPFLRNALNNQSLSIALEISETTKEDSVYSPNEKYQHLLKINPSLEDLRTTFDLDF